MSQEDYYDFLCKIVLVGDSGVGKTSLLSRYTKNEFSLETRTTLGVDFASKSTMVDGKAVKATVWDTAGQERFRALSSKYYRGASGAVIVYDVTKKDTFDSLSKWIKELRDFAPTDLKIIIVGNKTDLKNLRAVSQGEAKAYAESHDSSFVETSALDASNVEQAFGALIAAVVRAQRGRPVVNPSESEFSRESVVPVDAVVLRDSRTDSQQSASAKKSGCACGGKSENAT